MRTRSIGFALLALVASACSSFTKGGSVLAPDAASSTGGGGAGNFKTFAELVGPWHGKEIAKAPGVSGDLTVIIDQTPETGKNLSASATWIGTSGITATGTISGPLPDGLMIKVTAINGPGTACGYTASAHLNTAPKEFEGKTYPPGAFMEGDYHGIGGAGTTCGDKSGSFWLALNTVVVPPPSLACGVWPKGVVGVPFSGAMIASGGVPPYGPYVVAVGSLPAGLVMSPTLGVVTGIPTTAGTSAFQVSVSDARGGTAGTSAPTTCSITIDPPPCVGGNTFQFPVGPYVVNYPPGYPDVGVGKLALPTDAVYYPWAIPAGTWHFSGKNGGNHISDGPNGDPTDRQKHEQVKYVFFYADSGTTPAVVTGVSNDVPPYPVDSVTTDFGDFTFIKPVVGVRVLHGAPPLEPYGTYPPDDDRSKPNDSVTAESLTYACPAVAPKS